MLSASLLLLSSLAVPAGDGCPSRGDAAASCSAAGASLASATAAGDIVDTAVGAGGFTTLTKALQAAGLVDALRGEGPFTVFAPTDEAFAALPKGTLEELLRPESRGALKAILTYHVVPGAVMAKDVVKLSFAGTLNGQRVDVAVSDDAVTIDGAKVTKTDIRCTNGVIHVIDRVILPSTKDVVTTAVEAGSFTTLAKALQAAGLVEALRGEGPFTVFAPTDEAFAALPKGTLESLLKPEGKERLAAILKLHVVPGRVYSDAAAKGAAVKSLNGEELRTRSEGGKVLVGEARVVRADLETSNGVIHVIDRVLLPK